MRPDWDMRPDIGGGDTCFELVVAIAFTWLCLHTILSLTSRPWIGKLLVFLILAAACVLWISRPSRSFSSLVYLASGTSMLGVLVTLAVGSLVPERKEKSSSETSSPST